MKTGSIVHPWTAYPVTFHTRSLHPLATILHRTASPCDATVCIFRGTVLREFGLNFFYQKLLAPTDMSRKNLKFAEYSWSKFYLSKRVSWKIIFRT
jgi:hypothetical protein